MKNHFLLPYSGNKRQEVEDIYKSIQHLITDDIKIIIEPYCGTFAFSFYLSSLFPKRFKYILNDNNKYLIDLINIAKDEDKLNELIEKLNIIINGINNKEDYINIPEGIERYIIHNKWYNIHIGRYPNNDKCRNKTDFNYLKKCPVINFLRNEIYEIYNDNGVEIINQYKNDKNALIFIDPPYMQTCNDFYVNPSLNIYEYLYDNEILLSNSIFIFCLENIWIVKMLFNKYKLLTIYDKKYSNHNSKKTTHAVYSNK